MLSISLKSGMQKLALPTNVPSDLGAMDWECHAIRQSVPCGNVASAVRKGQECRSQVKSSSRNIKSTSRNDKTTSKDDKSST